MDIAAITTPIIFVGGKGGVGKTTIAAALAVQLAEAGKKTLLVSTDPAHSLSDVLQKKLKGKEVQVFPQLAAIEVDAAEISRRHFQKIEATLQSYAKPEMFPKIKEYLRLSQDSPGGQEAALLEYVCRMITRRQDFRHIVFDTAPGGHTLRLLSLPSLMSAWTDGLLQQQNKQKNLKEAAQIFWQKKSDVFNPFSPKRQNRWQQANEILEKRKKLFVEANTVLSNPQLCSFYLVMVPQPLPLEETQRTVRSLQNLSIHCAGIFINQIIPAQQSQSFWQEQRLRQESIMAQAKKSFPSVPKYYIELSQIDLRGRKNLLRFPLK